MKKLLYALTLIAAFAGGTLLGATTLHSPPPVPAPGKVPPPAAETQPTAAEKQPPPPGFALQPARHDFGKLFEGETRSIELTIDRPADKPLRLGRLYSPCPCIRVEAAPLIVEPGKPAKVTVVLHSLTLEGKKTFPAYVEILEPKKGILRADVDVEVERVPARLMLTPESFHLGSVTGNKTSTVKLTNLTRMPMHILDASSALPGSKVEIKGSKTMSPGEAVEIQLSIAVASLDKGAVRGEVLLKTDCPLHSTVIVPVDGTVGR